MPKKKKGPPFTGLLNEPIAVASPISIHLAAKSAAERNQFLCTRSRYIVDQKTKKLLLLLDHYKIGQKQNDRWLALSLALASDFVPGMKIIEGQPRGPGRPGKWKGKVGLELIGHVQSIKNEKACGIARAIRIAQNRYPNKWGKYTPKELESRYHEAFVYGQELSRLMSKPFRVVPKKQG